MKTNTDGRTHLYYKFPLLNTQLLQVFFLMAQLVLPLPNRTDFGSIWRTSKNSRTLSAENAWSTWYCVVYGIHAPIFKIQYSRIAEKCHFFTEWAKRRQLAAHHTNSISSPGCMVLVPGTSRGHQEAGGRGTGKGMEMCLPSRGLHAW